jgi:hypothetical protein
MISASHQLAAGATSVTIGNIGHGRGGLQIGLSESLHAPERKITLHHQKMP